MAQPAEYSIATRRAPPTRCFSPASSCFAPGISLGGARQMSQRAGFDRVHQPARLAGRGNQVVPPPRRQMTALVSDARDVGRDRVDAAEVVEQPGVEPFGFQRVANAPQDPSVAGEAASIVPQYNRLNRLRQRRVVACLARQVMSVNYATTLQIGGARRVSGRDRLERRPDAAIVASADADLQGPGRLRRRRRARHRQGRALRPRSHARRLSGLRRRPSPVDHQLLRGEHSGRSRRPAALFARYDARARRPEQRDAVRGTPLRDDSRRRAHRRAQIAERQGARAAVHRALSRRQRRDGHRPDRRPNRGGAGVHEQQAAPAGVGRQVHGQEAPVDHAGAERASISGRPAAGLQNSRVQDPYEQERAFYAQQTHGTAAERGGVVQRRSRAPEDDSPRERGDRLRHQRRHPAVRRAAEQLHRASSTTFARRSRPPPGPTSASTASTRAACTSIADDTIGVAALPDHADPSAVGIGSVSRCATS